MIGALNIQHGNYSATTFLFSSTINKFEIMALSAIPALQINIYLNVKLGEFLFGQMIDNLVAELNDNNDKRALEY
jgi:hypothetical protein